MKKIYTLLVLCTFAHLCLAQTPFTPLEKYYKGDSLIIPKGLHYDILFRSGSEVTTGSGQSTIAKGDLDLLIYIPQNNSSEKGTLYVSHETNEINDRSGDGGGATVIDISKSEGHWIVGKKTTIDFSTVGGTYNNCSGGLTGAGTVITSEEYPPLSNKEIYRNGEGFRDTSDINGLKRYQNMGWMVEADPIKAVAIQKLYKMGRFSHEGALTMPDNKTVYLTDDASPAVFFKFIADKENNYTEGQLYAYKQSDDGQAGSWITLPMQMDSLINIRSVALRMGATIFIRNEWITRVGDKVYFTETGYDGMSLDKGKIFNGTLAFHLKNMIVDNKVQHPYGAVLVLDIKTNIIKPLVMGGPGKNFPDKNFSNPDGITFGIVKGKTWLVINEDIIGLTNGRVSEEAEAGKYYINEIWWLDLSIQNPTTDDLQRFLVAPAGAETTGGYFTPDYSTYFVNIQHPKETNKYPFNSSTTIAVMGFNDTAVSTSVVKKKKKK